jgi:hypothetical protein
VGLSKGVWVEVKVGVTVLVKVKVGETVSVGVRVTVGVKVGVGAPSNTRSESTSKYVPSAPSTINCTENVFTPCPPQPITGV